MKNISLQFIIFTFSTSLWAADFQPGAVSTATGGAGRGTNEAVDGVLLNPAIVAAMTNKQLTLDYKPHQWGLLIADNGRDSYFPAALAFVRSDIDDVKTQQLSLAIGYSYKKIISAGLNFSMLEYDLTAHQLDQRYRQSVGDFGMIYSIGSGFAVGLVANKIFASKTELEPSLQKQKTVGLGGSYVFQNFLRLRFDVESDNDYQTKNVIYMGGLETFINDWMITRFGYQNNNINKKHYFTAGLGFSGPQFGLHYAYLSDVADSSNDQHSIDLGIPF